MPLWTAQQARAATGGMVRVPFAATGVSIDSRSLRPGDLFVALETESGDGHRFVADAFARGAAAAMVHRLPDGVPDDAALLQVADTLEGLHALGAFARARFGGRVVAITGSVGKTTTKEMLRAALAPFGKVWAAEASHNNQWGVPLTLARLPRTHDFGVVEIGMNHPGEIAPLARLARPDVAAITAIAAAHIGHMGSLEAIAREKLAIAEGLTSPLVLPRDGPAAALWGGPAIAFGDAADCAVRLLSTHSTAECNDLRLRAGEADITLSLRAPGAHMAMNAACTLACVLALGLDVAQAARGLDGFTPVMGRGARKTIAATGGEAVLLDESYNASAVSVRAALQVLGLQPAQRRLAVLGDMLELGAHGPAEHLSLAPDVRANADLLFTCGTLMRMLHEAVPELRGAHAQDAAALAPMVVGALRAGDAVLVKGSLGSRMRLVVQALEAAV
jgi:UDP-N-acetylmuramoyl-tripeptide--D-alanyl-D-alanine ligase